ncbi:cytochrome P450 2U1-like [Clavelina lepadiformis]
MAKKMDGPTPWPVVGSLLGMINFKEKTLIEWAETYGTVFQLKMGSYNAVALQGYDAIHEAFVAKAKAFSGRIDSEILQKFRNGKGLFFAPYGEFWSNWRSFAKDSFSAVHKTINEGIIAEAFELMKYFTANADVPVDALPHFENATMNVVLQTCFSLRLDENSPKQREIYNLTYDGAISSPKFSLLLFLPWMKWMPGFCGFLRETEDERKKCVKVILDLADQRLNEQKSSQDLVTCFYQSYQSPSEFDRESFALLVQDYLFAGTATTANQLLWILLLLLKNAKCLKKLQEELDQTFTDVGSLIRDSAEGKDQGLNYAKAVMEEGTRLRPIAPTSNMHTTTEDTSVAGFEIKKGTVIIPNLWSVHHDKIKWAPDPETFRPERHLDDYGNFQKSDHVMPFSVGWRSCVGQRIAESENLVYLVALVKSFDISLAEESNDIDITGDSTTLLQPNPFKVVFKERFPNQV